MDLTSGIANAAIANSAERVGDAVTISMLKKAMDIQAQNAAALIQALPRPPAQPVGSLGHNLDVRA